MIPGVGVKHPEMVAHALAKVQYIAHSRVNVGLRRVGRGAEQVRQPIVWILLHEVPNLLMRAVLYREAALLVLDNTQLERIVSLLLLLSLLLPARCKGHCSALTLLTHVRIDTLVDTLNVELAGALLEVLQHDVVLDVLQHLVVDSAQGCCAGQPDILSILVVLVVVLPGPGALSEAEQRALDK